MKDKVSAKDKELEAIVSAKIKQQFDGRIAVLEQDVKRLQAATETCLKQSGAIRASLKNVLDGLNSCTKGFNDALCNLEISIGFTNKELRAMSASDYEEKILKPLGMIRHTYSG